MFYDSDEEDDDVHDNNNCGVGPSEPSLPRTKMEAVEMEYKKYMKIENSQFDYKNVTHFWNTHKKNCLGMQGLLLDSWACYLAPVVWNVT